MVHYGSSVQRAANRPPNPATMKTMDAPRKDFPDRPWTIKEVAEYLQVSERTIRSRIGDSGMPHRYIGGALRFVRSEVDAWVTQQPGAAA